MFSSIETIMNSWSLFFLPGDYGLLQALDISGPLLYLKNGVEFGQNIERH